MGQRLAGKVAVVTGSTSGIGKATVQLFAEEGARVVVTGRRRELGEEVVAGIRTSGGDATFFHGDVAEPGEIQALVAFTVATYGRLDVLMNNAFSGGGGSAVELTEEGFDRAVATSIKAVYLGCKYAIPEMIRGGGGSIINVSSVHGMLAATNSLAYETVKAGMINQTRQIAFDFGKQGIRCNALCPGRIITEKLKPMFDDPETMRREEALYPLGRPGYPREVAYAALFLASDESSFITGSTITVDGGLTSMLQDTVFYLADTIIKQRGGHF